MWSISIFSMTLLLTLFFVAVSLMINQLMKKGQGNFKQLLDQNKILGAQLELLQKQIMTLNAELILLTEENKALNNEVSSLTKEVSRLQVQVNNIK